MTTRKIRPDETDPENAVVQGPGLDHVGDEDASQLPGEDMAIRLPIEEGDFDSQPR